MEMSAVLTTVVMLGVYMDAVPVHLRRVRLMRGNSAKPPSWWKKPDRRRFRKTLFNATEFEDPLFPKTCAARAEFGFQRCCDGQDQNCYTSAGCFCDVSCYLYFDDCCPDHRAQCYDELTLCVYEHEKKLPRRPRNRVPIRPNSCCGNSPFNTGRKTCCNGRLIRGPNARCESDHTIL